MNLGSIILGDLVTLAERGTYQGILILVWALAGAIGPTIVSLVCTEGLADLEIGILGWFTGSGRDLAMALL